MIKNEFEDQVSGTLIALRIVISALMKTHPDPEELLSAIRDILREPNVMDGQLPEAVQSNVDEILSEITSHLRKRI